MLSLPEQDTHFTKYRQTGDYQRNRLNAVVPLLTRYGLALDIGAHVGFWSRMLAERFQRVVAFEPQPDNFLHLIRNVPSQVECHRCALGSEVGTAGITNPAPHNSGAWHLMPGNEVLVLPLDHFQLQPDFIKIDVQGHEKEVIRGARKTLERHHPVIIVESDQSNPAAELTALGAVPVGCILKDVIWMWPEDIPDDIEERVKHVGKW